MAQNASSHASPSAQLPQRQPAQSRCGAQSVSRRVTLSDDLDVLMLARWLQMRLRNRQAGVTHYEMTFVVNEDATDIHVRNVQKDIATSGGTSVEDALKFLNVEA